MCTSQSQRDSGCNLGPRDCVFHKTVSRLPVANHIFLGSWIVDNCQCHSLRSAPQTRHVAHLKQCYHGASVKLSGGTGLVHKMQGPPGTVYTCQVKARSPELLGTWKVTKRTADLGPCPCKAPKNLSVLDLGNAQKPGPTWDSTLAEHPGA